MKWLFFVVVIVLSLGLSLASFVHIILPAEIVGGVSSNQLIFNRGMANIKKIRSYIQECMESGDSEKKSVGDSIEDRSSLSRDYQDVLRELEIIFAYQNYLVSRGNYVELREKSFRREVPYTEVNSYYREYESAKLYLERLLEQYPEGFNIIGSVVPQ